MNLEQLLNDSGNFPDKGMYGEAMQKARQKRREALMDALVVTASVINEKMTEAVTDLRNIRKQEKVALSRLEKMNFAQAYLEETGNPLPFFHAANGSRPTLEAIKFCKQVGVEVPDYDSPLWEVPKDWPPSNS